MTQARQTVVSDAGRGLGVRWVAMNDLTLASTGALALRLVTIAFFALLYLLPLLLRRWRGETTHERHATARADRERAELEADTAIAIKRAEVRREAEIMWADHQRTQARLAIEDQTEIDREQQRRRVVAALDTPMHTSSQRTSDRAPDGAEDTEDQVYLPIAPVPTAAAPEHPANLPAQVEPRGEREPDDERATPLIPSIPDATRAAARWIRPLAPPLVARVIDNATQPLRTARQAFEGVVEEVEEIRFSLKRSRRVTVNSASTDSSGHAPQPAGGATRSTTGRIPSSCDERGHATQRRVGRHSSLHEAAAKDVEGPTLGSAERDRRRGLTRRDGPAELRGPEGPRQLPPGQ